MSDNAIPHILLTRPAPASDRFAAALRTALGPVQITIAPLMEIVPRDGELALGAEDHLIFTSAAGVDAFAARSAQRGLVAWCVGARTADAAEAAGLRARSAGGAAGDLIALIRAERPKNRLLHLHGAHMAGNIAEALRGDGFDIADVAIYDQVQQVPTEAFFAALSGPVAVPLFSPRSAKLFAAAARGRTVGPLRVFALSQAVADAIPEGIAQHVYLADHPDAPALIRAMSLVFLP